MAVARNENVKNIGVQRNNQPVQVTRKTDVRGTRKRT